MHNRPSSYIRQRAEQLLDKNIAHLEKMLVEQDRSSNPDSFNAAINETRLNIKKFQSLLDE